MTALKGKAIEAFLARRDPGIAAVLVYGPDSGLARERGDTIARRVVADFRDPFNYLELTDSDLKDEPCRLADEIAALSMLGGERVIRLRTNGEAAAKAAGLLISGLEKGHVKPNGVVVIEAGDLAKTSGLRKLFEASDAAGALPCYADEPADVRALALAAAKAEDLTFDREALDLVVMLLGEDRGVTRAEIEKLLLYKGPKGTRSGPGVITIDDARAVLTDTTSDAIDEAAALAADGAAPALSMALARSMTAGSGVSLVRALQRQIARIRQAQVLMREGATAESAMARLRPPVFFMEKRAFEGRLRRWPLAKAEAALDLLLEAEFAAKTTGSPDIEIAERAAFRIAAMAG
jgi:DNA polymerase-3 subunit delta